MTLPTIDLGTEAGEPLWLPNGSVRSIIALTIVFSVFGRVALGLDVSIQAMTAAIGVALAYGAMRVVGK